MNGYILNGDFMIEVIGEFMKNLVLLILKILPVAVLGASFWFNKYDS